MLLLNQGPSEPCYATAHYCMLSKKHVKLAKLCCDLCRGGYVFLSALAGFFVSLFYC